MCFKRNFRENNNKNNKKIKPLWILFMRYTVETKFRLHNSPHKKIALRCCLTGETLVKLVLISSSGLNSMLSSPDVHKMIFWTTDHVLAVVTEIKQSLNYFNGEREVGCQRLFMRGSRIWWSLFGVQPTRIISAALNCSPREKTRGTERVRKVTTETKVHGRKGDEFLCPFSCLSLSQSKVNLIVTVTYLRAFFPHSSPAACSWLLIGSCRCVRQLWLVRIIPRLYHAFSPLF